MFARSVTISIALVFLYGIAAADVAPGTYSIPSDVSGGVQNLRAGPGQGHRIVVPIPAGAGGVQISECRSADDGRSRYDFCRARWNGHSGWISSCCLVPTQTSTPASAAPPFPTDYLSCRRYRNHCISECLKDGYDGSGGSCRRACDTLNPCETLYPN